MYPRILVPLDGSQLSEYALRYAQLLGTVCGVGIDLIYVIETEDIPEDLVGEAEQGANAYLQKISDSFPETIKPRCILTAGHAAEVIIHEAEQPAGTLIVMTTHGESGLQRWLLGGVAHKVVQGAASPVLLIPPGARGPEGGPVEFERIIVPLDGSPLAEHSLPHASYLCRALDMELILVRVYNPNFPGSSVRMHEISQIVHDAAEAYIRDKAMQLRNEGLEKVSYQVLRGIPAQQITDFALATPNSLTVICTHGRHGIGRWVLGRVTDAVIHSSEEPVLVVRAPQQKG